MRVATTMAALMALGVSTMAYATEKVWDDTVTSLSYTAFPPPTYAVEYDVKTHVYKKAVENTGGGHEKPWKQRTLTADEQTKLLALMQSLSLPKLVDQPSLPPGGFATYTLHGATGDKKLAVYGQGTYYKLDQKQAASLQKYFVQLIPDAEWPK